MSGGRDFSRAAGALKNEFDDAFARPYAADPAAQTDLLAIRVAGQAYVLRLSEVLAVHADRRLVPVPSPRVDLLGLVGVRGVVAPVYDLARLLGHPSPASPRWLMLLRTSAPFGLAFERFERHLRLPTSDVTLHEATSQTQSGFASGSVRSDSGPLPLIDLLALFQAVTKGAGLISAAKREETP